MHHHSLRTGYVVCFLMILFCSPALLYSQVVAGIKANGVALSQGDTVNVCKGSSVLYESAASGSLSIQWRFNSGSPNAGSGIGAFSVKYNTTGYDTTFQRVDGSNGFSDSAFIIVRVSDEFPSAAYTFSPDNVCGNIPIQFSNGSAGRAPLSYTWNFADGDTTAATTASPAHQFLTAIGASGVQTFPVKLVVTNALACKDSVTHSVTIVKIPDASIGNGGAPAITFGSFNGLATFKHCATELFYPFQFTNISSTAAINVSYTIQWGDGTPDSTFASWPATSIITHTFPRGGSNMTVLVTGQNGCIGIKKYNVFLGTNPAGGLASLGNTDICSSESLSFNITGAANNPPGTQYIFSINDGTPSQAYLNPPPATVSHYFITGSCGFLSSNGSITYNNSYAAYLLITNPCGSTSPSVLPIYVSGKPRPVISIPAPVVCINTNVSIQSASSFGNVVSSGSTPGNSSCANTGKLVWEITPSTYTLVSGTLGTTNANPALWVSGTQFLNINFNAAGTYSIKLTLFNDRCGLVSTTTTICVRNPPQASFTMDKKKSCGAATVNFTNTSPAGGCQGNAYRWDITYADPLNCAAGTGNGYVFAGGTTLNSVSPAVTFSRAGRYAIRLTTIAVNAFSYCQQAFAYDTFYVTGPPVATLLNVGNICVGNSINPTANVNSCYASGPLSYEWIFAGASPAGSTSLIPGSISYATVGNFPVQFIVTDAGCNQSVIVNAAVIVGNKPVAEAGANASVCSGQTVSIGSVAVPGVTYQWLPATGISNPNTANPTVTLSYTGSSSDTTYKLFLTAAQGSDCSSVDSVEINIKKKPVLAVNPLSTAICAGDSVQLTASGAATYLWTPPASLSNTNSDTVVARPSVTTTYTVTGTAQNGCADNKQVVVTVRPKPVADAGADASVCSGTIVPLGVPPSTGISYVWSPATGLSNSMTANPTATLVYSGPSLDSSFVFYLTASLGSFCSSTDSVTIAVKRKPLLTVTPVAAALCAGDNTTLTATGATNYSWLPVTGLNTATGPVVTAAPATSIVYTVTGSLPNGCTDAKSIPVTVGLPARAQFTASNTVLCAPVNLNTIISVTPYPAQNSSYNWYANNVLIAVSSTAVFPSYSITAAGDTVTIKLVTISSAGCKADSMEKIFITRPSVQASFTKNSDSACAPLLVSFNNTTPAYANTQYSWNFGNGSTSTLFNPAPVTYNASPGFRDTTYYITLTSNSGCAGTVKRDSVKVFAVSQARFGVNSPTGCSPFTAVFTNTSRGNNTAYYWNFGDGQTTTTYNNATLSHTYTTGNITTYMVQLIAENRCGRDTQQINLQVAPSSIQVLIEANGNQLSGCAPHTVTFNNSSAGAAQLTWNFGDGSPTVLTANSQATVTHSYQLGGNFTVTVRLQNSCTDTTIKRNITVYTKPIAGFSIVNPVVCPGMQVNVTNTSQFADSYLWVWGDGSSSSGQTGQHSYTVPGNFTVLLVASKINPSGFICSDTAKQQLTVTAKIAAGIQAQPAAVACAPFTYTAMATAAAGALLVEWTITNTATLQRVYYTTGQSMAHELDAGNYQVKLIVHTTSDCTDSSNALITVYNKPTVSITPLNIATCNHDTIISFTAKPTYNGNDSLLYNWFINGVLQDAGNPWSHRFVLPASAPETVFLVQGLAKNAQGCGDTSQAAKVSIYALPVPVIQVSPSVVQLQPDYTFGFRDVSAADPDKFYTWDMGDKTLKQVNGKEITYQYGDTGSYKVKLYIINHRTGCTGSDSVRVQVLYVGGYLYVPNAMCMGCSNNALRRFLPLGKGLKEYRLRVYNTWGQVIFETTSLTSDGSPDQAWNGTMNGKPLQQGAYTWQVEARYKNGTEWKGMIYPGAAKPVKAGFIDIIK